MDGSRNTVSPSWARAVSGSLSSSSARWSISTRPVSLRVTASASAAVAISRCGRRGDHPLAKDWSHAGEAAFEVMVLDAGDQPAIGIVGEGREVRAPMGFAVLAGLRVGRDRDDGVVDRTEAPQEPAIGDAQPDLGRLPGLTGGLGAQHIAHRVADRQQGADDLSVAGQDAAAAFAFPDRDGTRPRRPRSASTGQTCRRGKTLP